MQYQKYQNFKISTTCSVEGCNIQADYEVILYDLYKKVEKIDEILFEIINPKGLSFEEDILIKHYDFPKEDLDDIDFENY